MTRHILVAWLIGHRGASVVLGLAGCGALFGFFAHQLLPSYGEHPLIPLWSLTPGTLAMIAAVGVENRLPDLGLPRMAAARAVWATALVALTSIAALPVAQIQQQRDIAVAAGFLALVTVALASLLGRLALVAGLAVDIVALTTAPSAPTDRYRTYLHALPDAVPLLVLVLVALGFVAYVVRGARRFNAFADDDLD